MRKLQLQFMVDEIRVASSCLIWSRQLRLQPGTARLGSGCPTSSNFVKPGTLLSERAKSPRRICGVK
jgi:hypothetical protein